MPFEDGMKFERERFDVLVNGIESKALRHLFLAERAAAKISDIPADVQAAEIRKVAVIGAGTMGGGIAMSFASAGIPVIVVETKQEALDARPRHDPQELRRHRRQGQARARTRRTGASHASSPAWTLPQSPRPTS